MKQPQPSSNRKQITPLLCWRRSHVSSSHSEEKPKPFQQPPKPHLIWHITLQPQALSSPNPTTLTGLQPSAASWLVSGCSLLRYQPSSSPRLPGLDSGLICSEDSLGFPSWIAASVQVPGPHLLYVCVCVWYVLRIHHILLWFCHLKKQICHFYFQLECKLHEVRNFCFISCPIPSI